MKIAALDIGVCCASSAQAFDESMILSALQHFQHEWKPTGHPHTKLAYCAMRLGASYALIFPL